MFIEVRNTKPEIKNYAINKDIQISSISILMMYS